jgi:hypothetical protein
VDESGFVTSKEVYFNVLHGIAGLLTLVTAARALPWLVRRWRGRRREPEDAIPAATPIVRGMLGPVLVVAFGVPFPLGLLADGEWWDEKLLGQQVLASDVVYKRFRFLDLS